MTSISAAILLTTALLPAPVAPSSQVTPPATPISATAVALSSVPLVEQREFARIIRAEAAPRPKALMPMYAGFVALQGYDVYSTTQARQGGAVEANPIMRKVVTNSAAFLSFKGAVTLSTIFSAERLWRKGHRKAAVVLMAVTGGMMAAVAANNARVLGQIR